MSKQPDMAANHLEGQQANDNVDKEVRHNSCYVSENFTD